MSAAIHISCDAAAAHSAIPGSAALHPRFVLAATILASSLAFIDGSVVNVALPAIGHSLAADSAALQWVVNTYLLPLSALLLLGGAAGDRFGRRRLLIAGTSVFALASLGCALASGLPGLLASRFIQGVGAAMLMPNSLAILGQTFAGPAKGRAIGIWAATGAAAGAVGPVLGGWLVDLGNWRAIFLINVPLALAAIAFSGRYVPDEDGRDQPLDVPGGLLATLGLGALTWALTLGSGRGGRTADAMALAGAGIAFLLLFLLVQNRRGARAMMPLGLFSSNTFVGLTLLTLFLYGALGGLFVLLPYVLIEVGCYSATSAGAALLPLPLVLSALSPLMGGIAARIGPRLPLAIGPLIVAAGFLLTLRIDSSASYLTEVLPAVLVIALGMCAAVAPLTTAVLNSVDAHHTGSASGFNSATARTGGLVATALVGLVLAAKSERLIFAFHAAMLAGATVCVAASLSAFVLIDDRMPVRPADA